MTINFKQLGTPSEFWEYFDKISQIPRCSGREHLIREYIKKGASSDLIQLTEISITDEGMKALAVPWNKITEIIVKKSSKK